MKKSDFLSFDFEGKNIVIIGKPTSGKTFISELLKKQLPNHLLVHTDDFLRTDIRTAITNIIDLAQKNTPHIVEGCLGYEILTTGLDERSYTPDVVVNVNISYETLSNNYIGSRRRLNSIKGFCYRNEHLLREYLEKNPPIQFIQINNSKRSF